MHDTFMDVNMNNYVTNKIAILFGSYKILNLIHSY